MKRCAPGVNGQVNIKMEIRDCVAFVLSSFSSSSFSSVLSKLFLSFVSVPLPGSLIRLYNISVVVALLRR